MKPEFLIAIDPGLSGAVAIWVADPRQHSRGKDYIFCSVLPTLASGLDVLSFAQIIYDQTGLSSVSLSKKGGCFIEKVGAMPGNGVTGMFKFGFTTGQLHGCIRTLGIPLYLVTPQAWKKQVLAGTNRSKNAAIDYCLRRFPHISLLATPKCKKHHTGMADALCILDYGMSQFMGVK